MVPFRYALLLLAVAVYAAPAMARQEAPVEVRLESAHATAGDEARVAMVVGGLPAGQVFSFQFEVTVDPTIATLEDIIVGGTRSEGAIVLVGPAGPGRVRVAAAGTRPLEGDGVLAYLVFRTHRAGESAVQVDAFLFNEGDPAARTVDGWLTVTGSATGTDSLRVTLPDTTARAGQHIRLPVHIARPDPGLLAVAFTLHYDPIAIESVAIDTAGTLVAGALARFESGDPGELHGFIATERPIAIAGELFTIVVHVGTHEGDTRLEFSRFIVNEGDPPVALPGSRVAIRTRPPGDVSGDGLVDRGDAELVLDFLAGRLSLDALAFDAADVSGNGLVSPYDAALILQAAAGLLPCFPVEPTCSAGKRAFVDLGRLSWNPSRTDGDTTNWLRFEAGESPVYSVAITLPLSTPAERPPELAALPDGWRSTRFIRGDSLHLMLAGPTPLPSGDFARFPGRPPAGVILTVNDRSTLPDAPESTREGSTADQVDASNFPNPFSRKTTLDIRIPGAGLAQLVVYDVLGREVARPLDGWLEAGAHHLPFLRGTLGAGVYLYVLEAGGQRVSRRLLIQ